MLGKDDQQKGSDLGDKHNKCLLEMLTSPWVRSWIFHFQDGDDVTSAKVVQCPRPMPKIRDKSQQILRYSPLCPQGQPPRMAVDKCIIKVRDRCE